MAERRIDAVARRLVETRADACLSVELAADKAGIEPGVVKRAEGGVFSLSTLARLNTAYRTNLDYLAF